MVTEDSALVDRCIRGDVVAWEQVVRDYSRRIFNLAYRFTNNHEGAEDLTQDVFVRVYRALGQYDASQGNLSNWLMRLARNLIIDDYRRRQRTPTDGSDSLDDHEYHLRGSLDGPERALQREERRLQVHRAIQKLTPELRECVILRDIEELAYADIVELLKIPEGTVKSRINRGRIELAKILKRMHVAVEDL
ncbi:MAG TPA: sigma-70 family RNA polymerase sigma factor [Blastocatellia bacterium]|nr:sigma-70 family RNA polymerase sigma factor [Blastocatellia bacterium]